MKKLIASAGLVAVGAVTLSAQNAADRMESTKPWSVSASLRGFYDDNVNTLPSGLKTDSFGFEISPAGSLRFDPTLQTKMLLEYIYSMRYYEARADDKVDQSHQLSGRVEHAFSELYKVSLSDSFVYTQEPQVIETVQSLPILRREEADVLRNRAALELSAKLTERASVEASYQNTLYDYDFEEYAALLNRVEHLLGLEGQWQLQENFLALGGYSYGIRDFTSSRLLPGTSIRGEDRSSSSHYFYGGVTRALSTQLRGTVKVGAEYTSYDISDDSTWNPYADLSLNYTYLPGSYVQLGFVHARNATDVVVPNPADPTDITLDAESSTVYAQLTHRISPALTGSVIGQYQHSSFRGGAFNSSVDDLFLAGVNLNYQFTENWSSEVGYNYDRLNSDLPGRGFSRNRVYVGVRASF
jgi:hypothetical protein